MKSLLVDILGCNYSKLTSFQSAGKTWFKAQDVCTILGLRNTSVAVKGNNVRIGYFGIDQNDIFRLSPHKNSTLYISEAGVYKLILKSRKPAAYMIKVQLSQSVLPEIMRQGGFSETIVAPGTA
ncbi:BRO-N domain-containing protein [Geomonas anaerohicana]|uniref:Bro-N domain-containing protein n=1 Tax=Geomonas anaerohicana TaxID=2798583 RepID=A0ABS0YF73_9BACT|nr:Bro-N domain-containing protein [Geomonas anaerohicana]MBJ6750971.1 Bro-N domain-containing protein [Geomonas anaerohicana]